MAHADVSRSQEVNEEEEDGEGKAGEGEEGEEGGYKAPSLVAVSREDRKTSKFMTKFERARVLGTRALQLR